GPSRDRGMLPLLIARNNDEFGGWNMMSAPTPSVRFAVSVEIPVVSPTTTRINVTSRATASTLTMVLTGRAARPEIIICFFMLVRTGALRLLHEFGSLALLQNESVGGEFLVYARFLERHFQRIIIGWALNLDHRWK